MPDDAVAKSEREGTPLLVALALTPCFPIAAQTIWVVDDDGGANVDFTNIQDAVDGAAEGDVLLVRDGSYDSFSITAKSLTITAERGSTVEVMSSLSAVPTLCVDALAAGQEVYLAGLAIYPSTIDIGGPVVDLANNSGTLWFEECSILGGPFTFGPPRGPGMRITNCTGVAVVRSTVIATETDAIGVGAGIESHDSHVTLYDSFVQGGDGVELLGRTQPAGGAGVELDGGSLFASGCTFTGGTGGDSILFLQNAGDGGAGMQLDGTHPKATILDCTFAGGSGGLAGSSGGVDGVPGPDFIANTGSFSFLDGQARSLKEDSPLRSGPGTDRFHGHARCDLAFIDAAPRDRCRTHRGPSGLPRPQRGRLLHDRALTPGSPRPFLLSGAINGPMRRTR